MENIQELRTAVEGVKVRSAWMKGVKTYALELVDSVAENYDDYCVKVAIEDRRREWLSSKSFEAV